MPLDFPNTPVTGQIWVASNGATYIWDGTKWIVQPPASSTGSVVNTFNNRAGNVVLTAGDVTSALGYDPASQYLNLAGGVMTGPITLPDGGNAISQTYGNAHYLQLAAGGTVTGATTFTGPVTLPSTATGGSWLSLSGGTVTGATTFTGPVTLPATATGGSWLPLAGGTLTGTTNFSAPVNIGSNTARQPLSFNGPNGAYRPISWQTAGSNRFQITCNNTGESGTATGSDLDFVGFDNTGNAIAGLNPALRWTRATGVFNYYGGVAVNPGALLTFHQAVQGVTINAATLSASATTGFQQSLSASGSGSTAGIIGMNQWNVSADTMAMTGQLVFHTAINYNFGGTGTTGGRGGLFCNLLQTGPMSGVSNAGSIEGAHISVSSTNSWGGTNTGTGVAGALFGENIWVRCGAGSVNLSGICGMEINLDAASGTTYQGATGIQVVSTAFHNQAATNGRTIGYALGGQQGSIGLDYGFAISAQSLTPVGTIIQSDYTASATNFPIGRGIDFRANTFSSDVLTASNMAIVSTGAVRVGTGYLDANASGAILDAAGTVCTGGTLTAPVTTTYPSDGNNYWVDDPYGGIWSVVFPNGAISISTITLLVPAVVRGAAPTNPVTLVPHGRLKIFVPGTITANLTWDTSRTTLSLNPSGGPTTFGGPVTLPTGTTGPWLPLVGGTVSGLTTFSLTGGTALSVTGSAVLASNTTDNVLIGGSALGGKTSIRFYPTNPGGTSGAFFMNRQGGTSVNDAPQVAINTRVDHTSTSGRWSSLAFQTTIVGDPYNVWNIYNLSTTQSDTNAGSHVGMYSQQIRSSVMSGGTGRGVGQWCHIMENRSQTGSPSSIDGTMLNLEIDMWVNDLDDSSPQLGRQFIVLALGQNNTSGAEAEASTGISIVNQSGSAVHYKSMLWAAARYSNAVLDTRSAVPVSSAANCIWLGTGQKIALDGVGGNPSTATQPVVTLHSDGTNLITTGGTVFGGPITETATVAVNGGSGAMLQMGDTVAANNLPLCYSYLVGASGGATILGSNVYYNAAGAQVRPNTAKNAFFWFHDNRSTTDGTYSLHYVSSAGAGGTTITFDEAGNCTAGGAFIATTNIRTNGSAGPTWSAGAGAPSSTQPVGSLYSNTSGAAGARLYVSAGGGTWTAVAGV